MPYSKKVDKELYELRIIGKNNVRVFYTFKNDKIILFDCYKKETNKIPERILKRAKHKLKSIDI